MQSAVTSVFLASAFVMCTGQSKCARFSRAINTVGQVQSVHVSEEALRGSDREGIEEMLAIALKDAQTRAKRQRDERMSKVTGGVQLPWFS